jgi:hypothetical protein
LARETYTARLDKKVCISESAQCYHFEFVLDELESFPFTSGQFVSAVAPDANGKMQTRAYSIASAAKENRFDLCVNRVEGGFFSNHLADLSDLIGGQLDPDSRAAWTLCFAGAGDGLDPDCDGDGDCADARLCAVAVPGKRA